MVMKNWIKKRNAFSTVAIILATVVCVFITLAMLSITIKGAPNLKAVFLNPEVLFALKLSLITASITTFICIIIGIPTAYALACTDFKLKSLYNLLIEIPLSSPDIMLGLSLLIMFSTMPGKWLSQHGIKVIFSTNGIVVAQLLVTLPFFVHFIKTAFMDFDLHMEVVAGSLGANSIRTFFLVTIPMCSNAILGASILAWSRALGEFGATQMLVGATRMRTETLSTAIHLNMGSGDSAAAMACAMLLLILSLFAQLFSYILTKNKIGIIQRREQ